MTETVVNVQEVSPNNNANKNASAANTAHPLAWIKINMDYFKTIPGIIKIAEFILGILCMIFASPARVTGTQFFLFIVTVSFIATLIWIFVYLLGVREALTYPINWILTELINTSVLTVLYCIGFIVQFISWMPDYQHYKFANITAAILAMINTGVYAFGSYLLYLEHKSRN